MVKETIRVYARVKPLGRQQQAGVGRGASCLLPRGAVGRLRRVKGRPVGLRAVGLPEGGRERGVSVPLPPEALPMRQAGESWGSLYVVGGGAESQPCTVLRKPLEVSKITKYRSLDCNYYWGRE